MAEKTDPATALPQVYDMLFGAWGTQAIYVAAKLGIADLLATGPKTSAALAQATNTHAPSLFRLMRFLTVLGLCEQVGVATFALTPAGEPLREGVAGSARRMAIWYAEQFWPAWGNLLESVRTGRSGFDLIAGKKGSDVILGDPANAAVLNDFMFEATTREAPAIVAAYDFSGYGVIADLGGGYGALLAAILGANPNVRGILLDLPHSADGARQRLAAAGVANRCQVLGGSFFESVPAGADLYLMKNIIHDWHDDRCHALLTNIRRAMSPNAKLLVIEQLVPETVMATSEHRLAIRMDLTMMLGEGCERTEAEFRALLGAAGFSVSRVVATSTVLKLIEARHAS
jgi:orsellinic acid C2-O-methyltransferase